MIETIKNIGEKTQETLEDIKETISERLFSPMYFYFIIAWVITNWKFVYTLISTDEQFIFESKQIFKPEYLSSFYSFDLWLPFFFSVFKLFIIPIVSTFVIVWWISIVSEKFYEKTEQHKQNKRIINRKLEYQGKVQQAAAERKIRDAETDKEQIKYENQKTFNEDWDVNAEEVLINEVKYLASEALYNVDYESYKQELYKYKEAFPNYNEGIFSK